VKSVFILFSGTGEDGDPWKVEGVFSTETKALEEVKQMKWLKLGTFHNPGNCKIDEWFIDA
jgi:hypothetical protein